MDHAVGGRENFAQKFWTREEAGAGRRRGKRGQFFFFG
jgi:hypothetical protein